MGFVIVLSDEEDSHSDLGSTAEQINLVSSTSDECSTTNHNSHQSSVLHNVHEKVSDDGYTQQVSHSIQCVCVCVCVCAHTCLNM